MHYEHPTTRSLPITMNSQNIFMLEQAKLRVENDFLNKQAASNKDSRYNSHLLDTIDQERINKNVDVACNRQKVVPNKFANRSINPDNNIALYNIRDSRSLNEQNIIGNVLPEKLRERSKTKVMTPNAWMKDYDYIKNSEAKQFIGERFTSNEKTFDDYGYGLDMETGNYNGYMSQLLASKTNQPVNNMAEPFTSDYEQPNAAMFPDMRLQQNMQTQQRQFKDENAKVIDAMNLRNSPYIKERNARQAEMTILMNHNGQMKIPVMKTQDYEHFLDEQNNGINGKCYEVDDSFKQQNSKFNSRNSGGQKMMTNRGCDDNVVKIGNITRQQDIPRDVDKKVSESFNPIYNYDQTKTPQVNKDRQREYRNIGDTRDTIDKREYYREVNKQGRYIDDAKKTLYINNKDKFNSKQQEEYGKGRQHQNHHDIDKCPVVRSILGEGFIAKEAFNQADHILITRTGEVSSVYTNPNETEVAPVLVGLDGNNKPTRTLATVEGKNLYIIQKRDPCLVDIETGDYYKDSCAVLKIPLQDLNTDIRRRIEFQHYKQNGGYSSTNKRNPNKIVALEYDDMVELAETMNRNPDKVIHLKTDSLNAIMKDSEFDKKVFDGIDDDRVFTTPVVVQHINQQERIKMNVDAETAIKQSNEMNTIIHGGYDRVCNSTHMVDVNKHDRTKCDNEQRIDKTIYTNYADAKPVVKDTDNTIEKSHTMNDYTMRNNQTKGHYFDFEDMYQY